MQSDLELLELAAKATGNEFHSGHITVGGQQFEWVEWNPLTDDGDALRLAVKLGFRVRVCDDLGIAFCTSDDVPTHQAAEGYGSDRYAATRRAITRAAAQLAQEAQEGK